MARVLAEGAVEIVPESEGFASELRGDLNRDLTAATAGLDKNVRVRVTTDVDTAEAQIRGGLARLQVLSLGLLNRIQTRAGVLYRFLEQRVIIRTANKIREWVQKTIQRTKLLLEPYWRWMRERVDQIRRGWVRVRDTLTSAAEAVGRRWRTTLTALGSAFNTVRDQAQRVFAGLAEAAAPHLARLRRGIELLTTPFRVVRAYGQATFRILGDAGTAAFRRVQTATAPMFRAIQTGFDRAGAAARRWGTASANAARGVVTGLGRMRDGFRSADAAASAFSGRMGTLGGVIRRDLGNATGTVRVLGRAITATARSASRDFEGAGRSIRTYGNNIERTGRSSRIARTATRLFGGAVSALTKPVQLAGRGLSTLQGSVSGLISGKGGLAGLAMGFVTAGGKAALFAGIAGLVTYAVGAVGAALTGIPALALGAAAAIGVFVLGMDGIKRAFERTKPAVEALKREVSDAFERTMIPAAETLANTVLPGMTDSMVRLAESFGNGTTRLVEFVARAENMRMINQIIDNMAQNVTGQLIPALENIIGAFIRIGSNAAIMRDIIGIFTDLTNRTAAWLDEMNRTGQAEAAMSSLRGVMDSVVALFFRLLTGATQFFTEATPGFTRLLDSITLNESVMRTLGEAFGTAAEAAGDLLAAIPPSTWQSIADAAGRLSDKLKELGNNPAVQRFFQSLLDTIPGVIDTFTQLADAVGTVIGVFDDFKVGVAKADKFLADLGIGFTTAEQDALLAADAIGQVPPAIDETADAAQRGGQGIRDGLVPPLQTLPGEADAAFTGVNAAAGKLQPLPGTSAAAAAGAREGIISNLGPLPGQADIAFGGVNAAGDKLQPLPNTAAAAAAGAQAGVESGLQPMPGTADAAFQGVTDAAESGMEAARAAAETGATGVRDSVQTGMDGAAEAASAAMPRVSDAVTSAMDAAASAADSGGQRIGDAVRAGVEAASDAASTSMTAVSEVVESNMQRAGASAETGGQRIGDGIRTGAEAAAEAAEAGMERVPAAVEAAMDAAAAAAEAGGQQVEDALRTSTEAAAEAIEAGMERITTAVDDGMQQAVDAATDGSQQIEDALRTSFDAVVQLTEDAWRRIVQAFQQGGQQAVSIARATGDQIVSTFQALAGPMYNAGVQIIARLAAGMISAQGQAFAAAASTAAGIRAQFPASPAKEGPLSGRGDPLRSGGVIIERLAAGIAASGAAVQAALGPILASLVAQVNQATVNPMVDAAREILARLQSGGPIYEDLTWRGASANVGRYNDGLLDAMDQSGVRDPRAFLEDFIRRNTPGDTPTGGGGGVLGELQTQTAVLIGMRGDLAGAGYGPDMLARLDDLIAAVTGNAGSATGKAGSLRDLSEMGAFP